ncbi:hypothetical protein A9Q78_10875, partial [Methylophaga sp. 41_12_T18]
NGEVVTDQDTIDMVAARVDMIDYAAGTYNINGNFDFLDKDDKLLLEFDYVATDDSGTTSNTSDAKTVSLTVTGTNDAPIVQEVYLNETLPGVVKSGNGTSEVVVAGEIVEIGSTDVSVDQWAFSHGGGDLTISVKTEYDGTDINGNEEIEALDTQIYLLKDDGTVLAFNDDEDYDNDLYDSKIVFSGLDAGSYSVILSAYDLTEADIISKINDITLEEYELNGGTTDTWWYTGPYEITFTSDTTVTLNDSETIIAETNGYETIYTGTLEVQDVDLNDSHSFNIENVNEENDYGVRLTLNGEVVTDQDTIDMVAARVDMIDYAAG